MCNNIFTVITLIFIKIVYIWDVLILCTSITATSYIILFLATFNLNHFTDNC